MSRIRPLGPALLGFAAALGGGIVACAGSPVVEAAPPAPGPTLVFDPPSDLPAPEALVATSAQYRAIPLQWDPVLRPDVAGYLVESSPQREGPFEVRATLHDRGVLAWADGSQPGAPLEDGATRFYRLRSFAQDGRVSRMASGLVVGTTAALPQPPEELRAYSRQPRSVPLAWNAASDPGVDGYSVERSPGPGSPFEVVAELDGRHATHLLDAGLGDLRVLYYRVSSRNRGGQRGPPSAALRAVTKPAPLPPIGLHVEARRLGGITLAWEPNVETDLKTYRLLRWRAAGLAPETAVSVDARDTRAEDTAVGAGEAVSYAVVAIDQDELESVPSEWVATEGVGYEWVAAASPDAVRLRWNPRSTEGFARARVTRSWLWQQETRVIAASEIVDRDVSPGRHYRYVIVLEHADGWSAPPSQPVEVQVPENGAPFVEIRAPAPRIPRPGTVPR